MYANIEDVRKRVGRPIAPAEEDLATAWLSDVLRYITRGFQARGLNLDVQTQVAVSDPSVEDVKAFQAEAVAVRIRSFDPENLTSVTRSLDDGSITKRRENQRSETYEWLTDQQWEQLLPLDTRHSHVGSTRLGFTPDCGPHISRGW